MEKTIKKDDFQLYQRIQIAEHAGTIMYIGKLQHEFAKETVVQNKKDTYLGIAWDDPERGKHKGTVKGFEYFTTDSSASLIKPEKAEERITLQKGILRKYFRNEEKTIQEFMTQKIEYDKEDITKEFDDDAYFETVQKVKKKVEFLGFDKIWNQLNDLNTIENMSLPDLLINDVGIEGSIRELLPNLKVLSIERNLIYDWNQVYLIGRELPHLEHLYLSRNRLKKPENCAELKQIFINATGTFIEESPKGVFKTLKVLTMVGMALDWSQVSNIIPAFPNLEELILKENRCRDFENIRFCQKDLPKLRSLNIETNELPDFTGLRDSFQDFKTLEKLNINHNMIKTVGKFTGFKSLKSLSIDFNKLDTCDALQKLAQFTALEEIRIKTNPISGIMGHDRNARYRTIAEVKTVIHINGSEIKKYQRKDCEIHYLRETFKEYFEFAGVKHYDYDFEEFQKYCVGKHIRIEELIKMYGNPFEVSKEIVDMLKMEKQATELVRLKLSAQAGPFLGQEPLKKKFPINTTVQVFAGVLSKIFNLDIDRMIIQYHTDTNEPFEILDDYQKDLQFYSIKDGGEVWCDIKEI